MACKEPHLVKPIHIIWIPFFFFLLLLLFFFIARYGNVSPAGDRVPPGSTQTNTHANTPVLRRRRGARFSLFLFFPEDGRRRRGDGGGRNAVPLQGATLINTESLSSG